MGLRKHLTHSPYEVLNPFSLAEKLAVQIISLHDAVVPAEITAQLLINDPSCWDAGCIKLPGGKALILYNPTHAHVRINATIMEELAHLFLGHKASKLIRNAGDLSCRTYRKSDEKQAFAVGSAALIPSTLLSKARVDGLSRTTLSKLHNVSEQLITYRENTTGIKL